MSRSSSGKTKSFTGQRATNIVVSDKTTYCGASALDNNYETFLSSPDERRRINALLRLCRDADSTPSDQLLPVLMKAVQDPSPIIQQYALIALGKLGDASTVSTLVAALDNPSLRLVSLHALGVITELPEIVVPAIIAVITHGDTLERREALSALGAYGPKAEKAIPLIQSIALERNHKIRHVARLALHKIKRSDHPG